jgi:hypothetical protein
VCRNPVKDDRRLGPSVNVVHGAVVELEDGYFVHSGDHPTSLGTRRGARGASFGALVISFLITALAIGVGDAVDRASIDASAARHDQSATPSRSSAQRTEPVRPATGPPPHAARRRAGQAPTAPAAPASRQRDTPQLHPLSTTRARARGPLDLARTVAPLDWHPPELSPAYAWPGEAGTEHILAARRGAAGGSPTIESMDARTAPLRNALKKLARLAREKPVRRGHRKVLLDDLVRRPALAHRDPYKFAGDDPHGRDTRRHLDAAIAWLCRAQDHEGDRGVATAYSFRNGWMASYPETSGYIIETFLDYRELAGDERYRERALEMADWLLSIQFPEGAFQAGPVDKPRTPSVFNSGQILLGLVRAQRETESHRFFDAAIRTGDWLLSVQDGDGAWRQFAYRGIPHAYYSRVAWALVELHMIAGEARYRDAAVRQLRWALGCQNHSGWFRNNSFDTDSDPFTHTILYAAEGLFGAGMLLDEDEFIGAADRVAAPLAQKFEVEKFLPGHLDERWKSDAGYTCLTGDAQLSGLLINLYTAGYGDARYLNTALKLNEYLKSTQALDRAPPFVVGGIKGSDPVWGHYMPYSYPNWAAKFFADALLLEERAVARMATGAPA